MPEWKRAFPYDVFPKDHVVSSSLEPFWSGQGYSVDNAVITLFMPEEEKSKTSSSNKQNLKVFSFHSDDNLYCSKY